MYSFLLGNDNKTIGAVLNTKYDVDMKMYGTVRGLKRNHVYIPHIEVVTSVSLNQNATMKVCMDTAQYGNTGCGVFKWGYKIR